MINTFTQNLQKNKGFTLIELLIVIVIIAILAAVVFVSLDPLRRFRDARDAARVTDATELLTAIKIDQIDNGGSYLSAITSMTAGEVYMVATGMTTGCDDDNLACDTDVSADGRCVDLTGLVTEGYIAEVPVSPAGVITWDDGSINGEEGTGYTLQRDSTGIVHVRSCESENTTEIEVAR